MAELAHEELAVALGSTQDYVKAWEKHHWDEGGTSDAWGTRARGVADDLYVHRAKIVSETGSLTDARYTPAVVTALTEVLDSLVDLGEYWDDYSEAIERDTSGKSFDKSLPRQIAQIDAGEDLLWEHVEALSRAVSEGARTACYED